MLQNVVQNIMLNVVKCECKGGPKIMHNVVKNEWKPKITTKSTLNIVGNVVQK